MQIFGRHARPQFHVIGDEDIPPVGEVATEVGHRAQRHEYLSSLPQKMRHGIEWQRFQNTRHHKFLLARLRRLHRQRLVQHIGFTEKFAGFGLGNHDAIGQR